MFGKRKYNTDKQIVDNQMAVNQMLVGHIKDTMNYLEPELDNEQILEKLVMVLTPMADTALLNTFKMFVNARAEQKLSEVKSLYAVMFDETETDNNN